MDTYLKVGTYLIRHPHFPSKLSQWLQTEDCLPTELAIKPVLWELLLDITIQNKNKAITDNAVKALHTGLEEGDDEDRQEFASLVWSMLPNVLSKVLIDCDWNTGKKLRS